MKAIRYLTTLTAVVLFTLLPVSLFAAPKKAGPIVVTINDVPNGAPVIQVYGAPNGYDIYTGEGVADPAAEEGALITLFGVNNYIEPGALAEWGGRFTDPTPWQALPPLYFPPDPVNYREYVTAVDIVWVSHDADVFGFGDLQVGFNSHYPGGWYRNGGFFNSDEDLGPVTDQWVTVYANETLVVRYKPHTYVAKGYVPFNGSMELLAGPVSSPPANIPENPEAFVREYNGAGVATHLGAMQIWMKLTIYPDQVYPYTDPRGYAGVAMPYSGNAVLTAANGDKLNCVVDGFEGLTAPPWWLEGSLTVTGGTGRFQGAKGSMTFMGLDADTITAVLDGTLSTVGKNKK